jgi:fructose 1,6-bisphosphatase
MSVIRIKDFIESDFAGSRKIAEKVRKEIEDKLYIQNENGITLDFVGVEMITQSFGDEIIGIMTRIKGIDFIKNNIRLVNHNDDIKDILNYVVRYSKKHFHEDVA